MGLYANDLFLDAGLNWIKDNAEYLCICSQEPTTYAEAYTTYMLSRFAVTSLKFTGPTNWTDAVTAETGRKIQVDSQVFLGSNTGTGNHVAIIGEVNLADTLMYVVPCDEVDIYAAVNETMALWTISIGDIQ